MSATPKHPGLKQLVMGTVSVLLFAVVLAEAYGWFERRIVSESAPWLAALLVNSCVAALAMAIWWRRRDWGLLPEARWPQLAGDGLGSGALLAYVPALAVLCGAIVLGFASQSFGEAERSYVFSTSQWLFILVVPAVEEWAFRVGAGSYFRKLCGPFWGGYLSAMLFSLVHSLPTWSRVLELKVGLLPGPLLLGILCEILLIGSGRILPAIALHMACNATVIIFTVTDGRWLKWLDFLYVGR